MVVVTVIPLTVVVEVLLALLQSPSSIVRVVFVTVGPTPGMFWVVVQLQVFDLLHPATANKAATAIRIISFFILIRVLWLVKERIIPSRTKIHLMSL